jgi:hypothetical protein
MHTTEPDVHGGAALTALSILPFVWNVLVSLRKGRVAGDDPWEGNSLEWATSSPPPHHNFHHLPEIHSERPVFDLRHGLDHPETGSHTDPQTAPNAANYSPGSSGAGVVGHSHPVPGGTYSSARTTDLLPTTSPPNQAASGGAPASEAQARYPGRRGRHGSALRPPVRLDPVPPQTSRCSTGVPVRTLAPACSTVAAGGPGQHVGHGAVKARCAAWAGVAESSQQPERNERE